MSLVPAVCLLSVLSWQATDSIDAPELFEVSSADVTGFDAEKLAEIDAVMQSEVEAGKIVGCLALIARGDDIAYFRMWGQRDRKAGQPMTADTIFRIYSMSKPITSVAAMQLVERGKLQLDDPVSKYIPALSDLKVLVEDGESAEEVPAAKDITVRDLLRHTSGFTYGFFGNSKVDQAYRRAGVLMSDSRIEDTANKLGDLPLLHHPGTRWHYSVSTDVLGRVIEVASGQRFDEYLQENIFEPLDMVDTSFMVPKEKLHRFAEMYRGADEDKLTEAPAGSSRRFVNPENTFFSGGGGLCSTTRDYLRFCQTLLNGGELDGKRILKAETVAEMTTDQLGEIGGGNFQFGLGFSITPEGEYSWGGAAGTRFFINPKRDLIGIYMIQINPYGGRGYGGKMKSIVYAADKRGPAAAPGDSAPMP